MCSTATSRLPLTSLTLPRRLRISSPDQAGNISISLIVVSFSAYFHLSVQNSSDLFTLGVVIGDIGFSAGAMLQEDLCRTQECAGQVCGGAIIFLSEHVKFVGLIDIGSCHWRHRVFSGGYVTGRPLWNLRMCWVSLWRGRHIFLSVQNSSCIRWLINPIEYPTAKSYNSPYKEKL